jgi:leucyl/phenylalanyl-tRNA--protein transferase
VPIFILSNAVTFPPPQLAREDGLLAIGGDLTEQRLLHAYRQGIFPWYLTGEPILWWSPDPRLVLYPEELHVARRLRRVLRNNRFAVTIDTAFESVIRGCAETRHRRREGTWLTPEMIQAYCGLYLSGYAHSVEVWHENRLAGGLYGVSLGRAFFGESMFARLTDASKVGFVALAEHLRRLNFDFIDCQVTTDHMKRFGAREIPRDRFLLELGGALKQPTIQGKWSRSESIDPTHHPERPAAGLG